MPESQQTIIRTFLYKDLSKVRDRFLFHVMKNNHMDQLTVPHFASFVCLAMGVHAVRYLDIKWEDILEQTKELEFRSSTEIIDAEDKLREGPILI